MLYADDSHHNDWSSTMTDLQQSPPNHRKPIAWIVAILCGACCATPLIALALGSTALTTLTLSFDEVAIGVALLAALLLY
ncbi:MAG: hypothetical protein FD130_1584, partial [Halothiobacillaceae bacterium]